MTVDTVSTSLITVGYGNSLQAMIAAGKYDWVNSGITAKRFPVEGTGTPCARSCAAFRARSALVRVRDGSMPDWAYRYRATQRVAADPVPKSQQLGARSAYSIEASGMQIRAFRLLRPVDLMWDVTRRDLASLRDRHLGLPGVQ